MIAVKISRERREGASNTVPYTIHASGATHLTRVYEPVRFPAPVTARGIKETLPVSMFFQYSYESKQADNFALPRLVKKFKKKKKI